MQGTRLNRRIIIFSAIILTLSIAVDLITKIVFKKIYDENGTTIIIKNFFYFTYTENSGSAFSFLAGKSWAQTFFKILTCFALIIFVFLWIFALKRDYKTLSFGVALITGGAIGNFIDRLAFDKVRDFIGLYIFKWRFPIFNIADVCLTAGIILFIAHFAFLDKDAIFKKKKDDGNISSN